MPFSGHVKAGAALAAAGTLVVAPVSPRLPEASIASQAVRLTADADSILNIPLNLFKDFFNIPYYNVQATNVLASSFFWTGNWWTPSATNIWGEDPGDPGHFMAIVDYMFPFAPQISGINQAEIDPELLANGTAGLGQQLAMLAAAELPVSASCDAIHCGSDVASMVPTTPNLTGITGIDRAINFQTVFSNFPNADNQLPLFANWFKVPPTGSTFTFASEPGDPAVTGNPTSGGIENPDAGVGTGGAVPTIVDGESVSGAPTDPATGLLDYGAIPGRNIAQDGFGFPGTITGPDGENLMPWAGVTFTFDPLAPVQQWFQSLQAPVDLNDFHLVSPSDVAQSMQALLAGLVLDFNPYVAGSPACLGLCNTLPESLTTVGIVKAINGMTPGGNPMINLWLDQVAADTANGATQAQVQAAIAGLQTGVITLGSQEAQRAILDELTRLGGTSLAMYAVNQGFLTDPGYLAPWQSGNLTGEAGGLIPPGIDADGNVIPPILPPGVPDNIPLSEWIPGSEYGGLSTTLAWYDLLNMMDPSGSLVTELTNFWDNIGSAADPGMAADLVTALF